MDPFYAWVEHTALSHYAHMSAPETFLAYLAGRTSRIRIGHGVVCLPPAMNHPIKVAERIATLDILSKGRVEFGVGKGGTQQEAGAFGYDLEQLQPQIDESMYLIPKILVQDEIEHDGVPITTTRLGGLIRIEGSIGRRLRTLIEYEVTGLLGNVAAELAGLHSARILAEAVF